MPGAKVSRLVASVVFLFFTFIIFLTSGTRRTLCCSGGGGSSQRGQLPARHPSTNCVWSQARRLTEVERETRNLIAAMTDQPVPEGTRVNVSLAGELGTAISEVRAANINAARSQQLADNASRGLVRHLLDDEGLSQADVAVALGPAEMHESRSEWTGPRGWYAIADSNREPAD